MDQRFQDIMTNQDAAQLRALDESDLGNFLIDLVYDVLCKMPLSAMNHAQQTLYLAIRLEDTCQADALPSLSEDEELFRTLPQMQAALTELGAEQTAALIGELIAIVPAGTVPEWEWFFADEQKDTINRLDSAISDYPDGNMFQFYLAYLRKPGIAEEILSGIASVS